MDQEHLRIAISNSIHENPGALLSHDRPGAPCALKPTPTEPPPLLPPALRIAHWAAPHLPTTNPIARGSCVWGRASLTMTMAFGRGAPLWLFGIPLQQFFFWLFPCIIESGSVVAGASYSLRPWK